MVSLNDRDGVSAYAHYRPFWLSPRQVIIIPVAHKYDEYANSLQKQLWDNGIIAEVDAGENTLPKKIRNAEIGQHNFIFVVGQEEVDGSSVNVRNRDDAGSKAKTPTVPFSDVLAQMIRLRDEKRLENKLVA